MWGGSEQHTGFLTRWTLSCGGAKEEGVVAWKPLKDNPIFFLGEDLGKQRFSVFGIVSWVDGFKVIVGYSSAYWRFEDCD